MDELLYFPTFQTLVQVRYQTDNSHLSYTSHKELGTSERESIEGYILKEVAPKTTYYTEPSTFQYKGMDAQLAKQLGKFQFHGIIRDVLKHKLQIDLKVQELIGHSMTNYYFEKVGEQIITIRQLFAKSSEPEKLVNEINKLETLLDAYNSNASQEVKLETIIPENVYSFYREWMHNF